MTEPKSITLAGPFHQIFDTSVIVSLFYRGQVIIGLKVPPEATETFPFQLGDLLIRIRDSFGVERGIMLRSFGRALDMLARHEMLPPLGITIIFKRGQDTLEVLITPPDAGSSKGDTPSLKFYEARVVPASEIDSDIQPLPLTETD